MSADWQAFWTSWQCDVWLTLMLLLTAAIYARGWFRLRARGVRYFGPWQLASMIGGLSAIYLALQSPLEAFGPLLLQMHMLQHLLLIHLCGALRRRLRGLARLPN